MSLINRTSLLEISKKDSIHAKKEKGNVFGYANCSCDMESIYHIMEYDNECIFYVHFVNEHDEPINLVFSGVDKFHLTKVVGPGQTVIAHSDPCECIMPENEDILLNTTYVILNNTSYLIHRIKES
jgi:hypothetical protein